MANYVCMYIVGILDLATWQIISVEAAEVRRRMTMSKEKKAPRCLLLVDLDEL